jgi:hypothetical protein
MGRTTTTGTRCREGDDRGTDDGLGDNKGHRREIKRLKRREKWKKQRGEATKTPYTKGETCR